MFRDKAGEAYPAKGRLEYHASGEIFKRMKMWTQPQHPGHAAAVLRVEQVFSGADRLA